MKYWAGELENSMTKVEPPVSTTEAHFESEVDDDGNQTLQAFLTPKESKTESHIEPIQPVDKKVARPSQELHDEADEDEYEKRI